MKLVNLIIPCPNVEELTVLHDTHLHRYKPSYSVFRQYGNPELQLHIVFKTADDADEYLTYLKLTVNNLEIYTCITEEQADKLLKTFRYEWGMVSFERLISSFPL